MLPPIAKLPAFVDRVETIARSVRAGRSAVVESTYHKLVGAAFRWLEAAAKVQSALFLPRFMGTEFVSAMCVYVHVYPCSVSWGLNLNVWCVCVYACMCIWV